MSETAMITEEREWHISPEMYARVLEIRARFADFGDDSRFVAEMQSQYGLKPFTRYKIIVEGR